MDNIYVAAILVVLMVVLSAFFSGMESAFLNKNRLRLEIDRKQSRMFDYIAGLFSRHQGQYITTILVGNNIALVLQQEKICEHRHHNRLDLGGGGFDTSRNDYPYHHNNLLGRVSAEVDVRK